MPVEGNLCFRGTPNGRGKEIIPQGEAGNTTLPLEQRCGFY